MIFLDRYALPVWLDPTPLVLERLKRYAYRPVREPFAGHLKQMERVKLTPAQIRREAEDRKREALAAAGRNGAKAQSEKARAEAALLGETMDQRLKRQKLQSQRRLTAERNHGAASA